MGAKVGSIEGITLQCCEGKIGLLADLVKRALDNRDSYLLLAASRSHNIELVEDKKKTGGAGP